MFYAIAGKSWTAALVTSDGLVMQATGNFEWACGRPIRDILAWAAEHDMRWSVSATVPPGLMLCDTIVLTRRGAQGGSADRASQDPAR